MNKMKKQGCLWGCGLMILVLVAIAGTGTWYAAQMTKEFKQVKASEGALVQAVAKSGDYSLDLIQPPAVGRIEAFLEVRQGLVDWRGNLTRAVTDFQVEREKGFSGPMGFYRSLQSGTELAPIYAGFWEKRNKLLLEQKMGPHEYIFLYRLIYQTWLGHDPQDGLETPRAAHFTNGQVAGDDASSLKSLPPLVWEGDMAKLDEVLAPYRQDLEITYSPLLNPLECLFSVQMEHP